MIVIISKGDDIEAAPLSADNYRWGKTEPGATMLARAILARWLGSDAQAVKFYQRFKHRTVREWDDEADFTITGPEIEEVLREIAAVEKETSNARRVAGQATQGPVVSERGQGVKWNGEDDDEE